MTGGPPPTGRNVTASAHSLPTFCPLHFSAPSSAFQQQPFLTLTIVHRPADLTALALMPAPETCMCQQADPPGLNTIGHSGHFDKVKCTKKSVKPLSLHKARPESIHPSPLAASGQSVLVHRVVDPAFPSLNYTHLTEDIIHQFYSFFPTCIEFPMPCSIVCL